MKLLATVFLAATALSASAFTLDFSNLSSNNGNPAFDGSLFIDDTKDAAFSVPPFGNVRFLTDGNPAYFDVNYGVEALEFDDSQTILVQFISGTDVENVVVNFVGVDGAELPAYTVTGYAAGSISIPSGAVGIASIDFDQVGPKVPEPSVSILGAMGALLLLRRRR